MDLIQTVAPTVEPLSLAEAKAHLRVDLADDEALITSKLKGARELAEVVTNRQFLDATWQLKLDHFPTTRSNFPIWDCDGSIRLPRAPVLTASQVAITYVDTAGVSQTLATTVYGVDIASEPGRVYLLYNQTWPSTRGQKRAVTITWHAGYGTAATAVPERVRSLVALMLGDAYEEREASKSGTLVVQNPTIQRLVSSLRVPL